MNENFENKIVAAPEVDLRKIETEDTHDGVSKEELAVAREFVGEIDLTNSQTILDYGVGTQKKIADFSEKAIENVKTKDLGEIGSLISGLVTELKNFEVDEKEKGFAAFFKKKVNKANALRTKYSKVETNVESIKTELEKRQIQLMKDSALLDKMYEQNKLYFKELSMFIIAGKEKLDEVRQNDLALLNRQASESGLSEDIQKAKDLANICDRFEKKLYDLQLSREIALQTSPQIRMVQSSNDLMVEKIQSTIVNTIPLWKNQMVIALGIEHANQAAKAQREVSDMTNELLRKNADALKTATLESVRESERGIVDIETIKHTNESLISTLDEVMNIQNEGRIRRAEAEKELEQIENQLKTKLLEAAKS